MTDHRRYIVMPRDVANPTPAAEALAHLCDCDTAHKAVPLEPTAGSREAPLSAVSVDVVRSAFADHRLLDHLDPTDKGSAKLMSMRPEAASLLRRNPHLTVSEEHYYQLAVTNHADRIQLAAMSQAMAGANADPAVPPSQPVEATPDMFAEAQTYTIRVNVRRSDNQGPVPNVPIRGIFSVPWPQNQPFYTTATSDENGVATLTTYATTVQAVLDGLAGLPDACSWAPIAAFAAATATQDGTLVIPTTPLSFVDAKRKYYDLPDLSVGEGVRVGVLDTGCGPHKDLRIAGGLDATATTAAARASTAKEPEAAYADTGVGHGTHVAGIIAARGAQLRGVAPGVDLWAYRIVTKSGEIGSWAVKKAVIAAADNNCHLINMSIGDTPGKPTDPAMERALQYAKGKGTVPFVSAGNNNSTTGISYPGAFPESFAVGAMGVTGLWPPGGADAYAVARNLPAAIVPGDVLAAFSNRGSVGGGAAAGPAATGCGLGIMSTFPHDTYIAMDGTSMAAPCTLGAAARLLTSNAKLKALLTLPQTVDRYNQIRAAVTAVCTPSGFGGNLPAEYSVNEGAGRPNVPLPADAS